MCQGCSTTIQLYIYIYIYVCVCVCVCVRARALGRCSHVQLFVTSVAYQAPLSMGFPRREYWSGLPSPPPGHLPDPGIEAKSLMSPALADGFFITSATWEAIYIYSFSNSFPLWVITQYWVEFPVLYSRSLLVICFLHSSAYMLIPNS